MERTKAEIMNDIEQYANGKELTPSIIRDYLMIVLHLSKATAYRFMRKSDKDVVIISQRKYEKRDNINYSDEEYKELTQKAFEILHEMGKTSLYVITYEEIKMIAEKNGTTPRFLSCNILGLDTNAFDKLVRGEIKESKLSLGLGFKDDDLSEKVKNTRKNRAICSIYFE